MTFKEYFQKATKVLPFPYQESLATADLSHLALAAPTGAGKTAAATLAWLWQRQNSPKATPRRLVICQPMRTLVEQTYAEVTKWLRNLGLDNIKVYPLLGGYKDEGWELKPEEPAIIVGTQDQLLSRALNRGYAMSRFRWPIPFGLLHSDTQWVFDEIQLMGPGLVTSAQLHGLRQKLGCYGNTGTLWMSATLNLGWLNTVDHAVNESDNKLEIHPFSAEDRSHPTMAQRLYATKPLYSLEVPFDKNYAKDLAAKIIELHQNGSFSLIIVNTVDRARELHKLIEKAKAKSAPSDPVYLLHSRFRPRDRQEILNKVVAEKGGKIVISTQVVEAGVDISADTLITELAPWPSLIQRFGRCNRKGEKQSAAVYWLDIPDEKAGPYEGADFQKARAQLEELDSVEPAKFPDSLNEPLPSYSTLRRRDLLELFNTAGDLCGLDIDLSRFIRDGDDRDVFIFWRNWMGETPWLEIKAPSAAEICTVSKFKLMELVKKDKIKVWYLDDLRGRVAEWKIARPTDILTGRTYLAHSNAGCYSQQAGWDPDAKKPVPEVGEVSNSPFPTMISDPRSESSYLTLEEHTNNVCRELDIAVSSLAEVLQDKGEMLKTAARLHDLGKAHPVFQETMRHGCTAEEADAKVFWAKRRGSAFHSRRYFRHELASALACLQLEYPFLVCYVIAAHHGKARLSIRSFPDEVNEATLGVIEGDTVPPIPFLGTPEVKLSLAPLKLGLGSWQDQALGLLEQLGPFKLAYLESLLRAADVRASIAEQKKGELINA